ncbi:MAG: aldolase/citrate lyase family protein [Gemmatimonadetes bacterium]|nr:aldolase/citrate lyase family protein [Gemmatimonadota bacterium]
MHSTWPSVVEAVGHAGHYDYVEFVAEYGPFDLYAFDDLARAAELHGLDTMVKVDQEPRGFIAQRAIGSGFGSVLFADCQNTDDIRECVKISRPDTPEDGGSYGVATRRFSYMGYGGGPEYVEALRQIVVVVMIEKAGTAANIEEALSVEGVDMIQWGGGDYSMSVGKAGERGSPEIMAVEKKVFETALKMGVPPRAEVNSIEDAKYYLDMGVKHFCIGTDIAILHDWWKKNGDDFRKVIGS